MNIVKEQLEYSKKLYDALHDIDTFQLEQIYSVLHEAIKNNRQIFVCGNGGSAAIATHFATDFFKGIATLTTVSPKIISLCENYGLISAIANDYDYSQIYDYQLLRLMNKDDVLVVISSSGNSPNIVRALEVGNEIGITIGLTGFDYHNNKVVELADYCLYVRASNYGLVEDSHQAIISCLSQSLRKDFAGPIADISEFTF